jgi:hypothetical protein
MPLLRERDNFIRQFSVGDIFRGRCEFSSDLRSLNLEGFRSRIETVGNFSACRLEMSTKFGHQGIIGRNVAAQVRQDLVDSMVWDYFMSDKWSHQGSNGGDVDLTLVAWDGASEHPFGVSGSDFTIAKIEDGNVIDVFGDNIGLCAMLSDGKLGSGRVALIVTTKSVST